MMINQNGINQLALDEASPEKAGVGGSSPSLATIFRLYALSGQNVGVRFQSRLP